MNQKSKLALSTTLIALMIHYHCCKIGIQLQDLTVGDNLIGFLLAIRSRLILYIILSVAVVCGLNYFLSLKSNKSWTKLRPATLIGAAIFILISYVPFTYVGYIMISMWVPTILSIGISVVLILMHVQGISDYKRNDSQ